MRKRLIFLTVLFASVGKEKDSGVGNCYRAEEQGLMQEQGIENCCLRSLVDFSEERGGWKDKFLWEVVLWWGQYMMYKETCVRFLGANKELFLRLL